MLLKNRANVNLRNNQGESPLMMAVLAMNADIAKLLLETNANVHKKDKQGCTVLHRACEKGFIDIVAPLIEASSTQPDISDEEERKRVSAVVICHFVTPHTHSPPIIATMPYSICPTDGYEPYDTHAALRLRCCDGFYRFAHLLTMFPHPSLF
jgi:ankyrin repeat protein